ncbi:MAG: DUF2752 domain-containing protein [Planctomycetota bacterium]
MVSFFLPAPDPWMDSAYPYRIPCCLFKEATGLPCPLCGLTRSFVSLSHGNVRQAFRYHPLGPLVYLAFSAGAISALIRKPREDQAQKPAPSRWPLRIFLATVGIFFAVWAAKLLWIPRSFW